MINEQMVFFFQLNVVLCAPPPLSIPSAVGSASPTENHAGSSSVQFGNAGPNGLAQKFGGFDPNQQQLIQNPTYGYQRPMTFPTSYNNQQPTFQMPVNYYDNGNGFFLGNPLYRPPNVLPPAAFASYGNSSPLPNNNYYPFQQQYPNGLQSSSYQSLSGLTNLSPFSRSSISQRKSDDLDKKPSH